MFYRLNDISISQENNSNNRKLQPYLNLKDLYHKVEMALYFMNTYYSTYRLEAI